MITTYTQHKTLLKALLALQASECEFVQTGMRVYLDQWDVNAETNYSFMVQDSSESRSFLDSAGFVPYTDTEVGVLHNLTFEEKAPNVRVYLVQDIEKAKQILKLIYKENMIDKTMKDQDVYRLWKILAIAETTFREYALNPE